MCVKIGVSTSSVSITTMPVTKLASGVLALPGQRGEQHGGEVGGGCRMGWRSTCTEILGFGDEHPGRADCRRRPGLLLLEQGPPPHPTELFTAEREKEPVVV